MAQEQVSPLQSKGRIVEMLVLELLETSIKPVLILFSYIADDLETNYSILFINEGNSLILVENNLY